MSTIRETTLEIDLKAFRHNYDFIRSKTNKVTKFMGVVKAFAYGNDLIRIAQELVSFGADYLAVAYDREGINLSKANIKIPVLIFHPHPTHFEEIIEHNLIPSIFSKLSLEKFIEAAEKTHQKNYPIHLKLNTGLNRLGFDPEDISFVLDKISKTQAIKVEGIFSHLAASEDPKEKDFGFQQIEKFLELSDQIIDNLDYKPLRHICNTSGIFNFPQAHFDMVRSGIGLYGYGNAPEFDEKLKPIGSLKTIISQIHSIQKGDSVSYNRKFIASRPMRTATLSFGYADGMHRNYSSGKTSVIINGKPAPIIGDVCMDMIMVDVTEIDCKEGDEVIIFGKEQSAEKLSKDAGTIVYELITTISHRVKRIFI